MEADKRTSARVEFFEFSGVAILFLEQKMKCLIIIDMQKEFEAARPIWLILNVVDKIKKYIARNEPILIVEYNGAGETVPEIIAAIVEYDNVHYVEKHDDDGADQIDSVLKINDLDLKVDEFEVCGVNLDACVMKTVLSMAWDYPNHSIEVPLDCCNARSEQRDATNSFECKMEEYDRMNVALVGGDSIP